MLVSVFLLSSPFITKAEDTKNTPPTPPRPTLKEIKAIRDEKIQEKRVENRIENRVEKRMEIKDEKRDEMRDAMDDKKDEMRGAMDERRKERMDKNASTTEKMALFKRNAKEEIKKKMEERTFEIRKNALIRELNVALRNIEGVDARIKTRIEKISSTTDTTEVKSLLKIAEDKLAKAKTDVASLESMRPLTASSTTASTSAEVDLSKPRVLGDAAIKSVKEARDAFKKVVVTIGHLMGNEGEKEATTTKPTI